MTQANNFRVPKSRTGLPRQPDVSLDCSGKFVDALAHGHFTTVHLSEMKLKYFGLLLGCLALASAQVDQQSVSSSVCVLQRRNEPVDTQEQTMNCGGKAIASMVCTETDCLLQCQDVDCLIGSSTKSSVPLKKKCVFLGALCFAVMSCLLLSALLVISVQRFKVWNPRRTGY